MTADLDAVAEPIHDPDERAAILFRILTESWGTDPERARADLDTWVSTRTTGPVHTLARRHAAGQLNVRPSAASS